MLAACARLPEPLPAAPSVVAAPPPVHRPLVPAGHVPYTGLLVDSAESGGARVVALEAGPAAQSGLVAGDIIKRCDGVAVDAPALRDRLADARPHQPLRLEVIRAGEPVAIELVPDERLLWQGPAVFDRPRSAMAAPVVHSRDLFARLIAAQQPVPAANALAGQNAALSAHFAELAGDAAGFHKSPLIEFAMTDPEAMFDAVQRYRAESLDERYRSAWPSALFCNALVLPCTTATASSSAPLADQLEAISRKVLSAFERVPGGRTALDVDARYLLEVTAAGQLLFAQYDAVRGLAAMRASMTLSLDALLNAFVELRALAALPPPSTLAMTDSAAALPASLQALVEGDISAWVRIEDGYIVLGGSGPNRYAMTGLVAVFDSGGDDRYQWDGDGLVPPAQLIVDRGGNDRYQASYGGPGSGWLGVGVLVDNAGNDHYQSVFGGCGAGIFGFGALIDEAGNDIYRCEAWSLGTGLYGGGAVLDDGDGGDLYLSQILSQGAGGPGGLGVLVDGGGDDLYRANGLVASAYHTPAVFMGLSQGIGYGFRPHDHGGIGMLFDQGGNDRYEGGEFSQGGGYFWGTGMLVDDDGNDIYYGNRYAQGYAVHQAAGLIVDSRGDDIYWAMTAAAQAAAWDESLAMLIDSAGNDVYRAATLSQGAAAHQSRALLFDSEGDDVYQAAPPAVQGAAGDNDYHWRPDRPLTSIGVLHDGGGSDTYTSGLQANEVRITAGAVSDGVAGLAIDDDCAKPEAVAPMRAEQPTSTLSMGCAGSTRRAAINAPGAIGTIRP